MKIRHLTYEMWLPYPIDAVFSFFSDATNLNAITPPWLHFRILSSTPLALDKGTLIEYKLKLHGFPVRWQSEIIIWEPPTQFVDVQRKGPYLQWIHRHIFEECEGGTLIRDRVDYALAGWFAESLIHALVVGPDLKQIFEYRKKKLGELFTVAR
jgi:ligand-binding SRPBCC domain-containing protein